MNRKETRNEKGRDARRASTLVLGAHTSVVLTQAMQLPDSEQWAETCAAEAASLPEHRVHGVKRSSLGGKMQGNDGVGVDSQPALDIVYNQMYLARPQQYHVDGDRVFEQTEL